MIFFNLFFLLLIRLYSCSNTAELKNENRTLKPVELVSSNFAVYKNLARGSKPKYPLNLMRIKRIVGDLVLLGHSSDKDSMKSSSTYGFDVAFDALMVAVKYEAHYYEEIINDSKGFLQTFKPDFYDELLEFELSWISGSECVKYCRTVLQLIKMVSSSKGTLILNSFFKKISDMIAASVSKKFTPKSRIPMICSEEQSFALIFNISSHEIFDDLKKILLIEPTKTESIDEMMNEIVELDFQYKAIVLELFVSAHFEINFSALFYVFFLLNDEFKDSSFVITPYHYSLFDAIRGIGPKSYCSVALKFISCLISALLNIECLVDEKIAKSYQRAQILFDAYEPKDLMSIKLDDLIKDLEAISIDTAFENTIFYYQTMAVAFKNVYDIFHIFKDFNDDFAFPFMLTEQLTFSLQSMEGQMCDGNYLLAEIHFVLETIVSRIAKMAKSLNFHAANCIEKLSQSLLSKDLFFFNLNYAYYLLTLEMTLAPYNIHFEKISRSLQLIMALGKFYFTFRAGFDDSFLLIKPTYFNCFIESNGKFSDMDTITKNFDWPGWNEFNFKVNMTSSQLELKYRIIDASSRTDRLVVSMGELISSSFSCDSFEVEFLSLSARPIRVSSSSIEVLYTLCRLHLSFGNNTFLSLISWSDLRNLLVFFPHIEAADSFTVLIGDALICHYYLGDEISFNELLMIRNSFQNLDLDKSIKISLFGSKGSTFSMLQEFERISGISTYRWNLYVSDLLEVGVDRFGIHLIHRYCLFLSELQRLFIQGRCSYSSTEEYSLSENIDASMFSLQLAKYHSGFGWDEKENLNSLIVEATYLARLYRARKEYAGMFPVLCHEMSLPFLGERVVFPELVLEIPTAISSKKFELYLPTMSFSHMTDEVVRLISIFPAEIKHSSSYFESLQKINEVLRSSPLKSLRKIALFDDLLRLASYQMEYLDFLLRRFTSRAFIDDLFLFFPFFGSQLLPDKDELSKYEAVFRGAMREEFSRRKYHDGDFFVLSAVADLTFLTVHQLHFLMEPWYDMSLKPCDGKPVVHVENYKLDFVDKNQLKNDSLCAIYSQHFHKNVFWMTSGSTIISVSNKYIDFEKMREIFKLSHENGFSIEYFRLLESMENVTRFTLPAGSIHLAKETELMQLFTLLNSLQKILSNMGHEYLALSLKNSLASLLAIIKAIACFIQKIPEKSLEEREYIAYISTILIELQSFIRIVTRNVKILCRKLNIKGSFEELAKSSNISLRFNAFLVVQSKAISILLLKTFRPSELFMQYLKEFEMSLLFKPSKTFAGKMRARNSNAALFNDSELILSDLTTFHHPWLINFSPKSEKIDCNIHPLDFLDLLLERLSFAFNSAPSQKVKKFYAFYSQSMQFLKASIKASKIASQKKLAGLLFYILHESTRTFFTNLHSKMSNAVLALLKYIVHVPIVLLTSDFDNIDGFLGFQGLLLSAFIDRSPLNSNEIDDLTHFCIVSSEILALKNLLGLKSPNIRQMSTSFNEFIQSLSQNQNLSLPSNVMGKLKMFSTPLKLTDSIKIDGMQRTVEFKSSSTLKCERKNGMKLLEFCARTALIEGFQYAIELSNGGTFSLNHKQIKSLCKLFAGHHILYQDILTIAAIFPNYLNLVKNSVHFIEWSMERKKQNKLQFMFITSDLYYIVPGFQTEQFIEILGRFGLSNASSIYQTSSSALNPLLTDAVEINEYLRKCKNEKMSPNYQFLIASYINFSSLNELKSLLDIVSKCKQFISIQNEWGASLLEIFSRFSFAVEETRDEKLLATFVNEFVAVSKAAKDIESSDQLIALLGKLMINKAILEFNIMKLFSSEAKLEAVLQDYRDNFIEEVYKQKRPFISHLLVQLYCLLMKDLDAVLKLVLNETPFLIEILKLETVKSISTMKSDSNEIYLPSTTNIQCHYISKEALLSYPPSLIFDYPKHSFMDILLVASFASRKFVVLEKLPLEARNVFSCIDAYLCCIKEIVLSKQNINLLTTSKDLSALSISMADLIYSMLPDPRVKNIGVLVCSLGSEQELHRMRLFLADFYAVLKQSNIPHADFLIFLLDLLVDFKLFVIKSDIKIQVNTLQLLDTSFFMQNIKERILAKNEEFSLSTNSVSIINHSLKTSKRAGSPIFRVKYCTPTGYQTCYIEIDQEFISISSSGLNALNSIYLNDFFLNEDAIQIMEFLQMPHSSSIYILKFKEHIHTISPVLNTKGLCSFALKNFLLDCLKSLNISRDSIVFASLTDK